MASRKTDKASVTLTIRMTREDRELLSRLVAKRASELSDEGLAVTATSVIRGMIRREARAVGLIPQLGGAPAWGTPPPARIRLPRTLESTPASDRGPGADEARVPMGIRTPKVPTGLSAPRDLGARVEEDGAMPDSDDGGGGFDADQVRKHAVQAIRRRKFRQRDLVERSKLPQQVVSRFLLGAESSDAQVRAIGRALEKLDG